MSVSLDARNGVTGSIKALMHEYLPDEYFQISVEYRVESMGYVVGARRVGTQWQASTMLDAFTLQEAVADADLIDNACRSLARQYCFELLTHWDAPRGTRDQGWLEPENTAEEHMLALCNIMGLEVRWRKSFKLDTLGTIYAVVKPNKWHMPIGRDSISRLPPEYWETFLADIYRKHEVT